MMHSDISQSPHITYRPPEGILTKSTVQDVVIPEPQRAFNKSKEIENWLREEDKLLERRRKGIKILLLGGYILELSPTLYTTETSSRAIRIREGKSSISF
jgi:hypothetical protein